MIDVAILAGVAVVVSSVLLVFGCVCHLFKRGPGFKTFENDLEEGFGNTIFSSGDTSDVSQVVFETIPDIIAKSVTATALRPRISCTNPEIQKQCARRVATYKAFPRSHITYIKEMGVGWFGQVLVSEAYNMDTTSRSTRVIVKMMKDDADSTEQQLFLQDLSVYRELDHPNILKLLGQCTEALPFLAILEHASLGSLKSYLRKEQHIVKTMKKGTVRMQFLTDMAAGLECLHDNGYLHHDFACRNCVVMSNMTVKIGDYYGVSEDHFRDDYYDNGQDLLPIRWMAPGSIKLSNSLWQVTQFTKQTDIWSFGVAMFEVTEYGEQPNKELTDEEVLQNLISPNPAHVALPPTEDPIKADLYDLMKLCWNPPVTRPTIGDLYRQLQKMRVQKDAADELEFERKWAKMSSKEARVVKVEVHASDFTGLKHNIVGAYKNADVNYNSVVKEPKGDTSDGSFGCEPVSGKLGRPDTAVYDTPMKPIKHQLTSTPVISDKDVQTTAFAKKMNQQSPVVSESSVTNKPTSSEKTLDVGTPQNHNNSDFLKKHSGDKNSIGCESFEESKLKEDLSGQNLDIESRNEQNRDVSSSSHVSNENMEENFDVSKEKNSPILSMKNMASKDKGKDRSNSDEDSNSKSANNEINGTCNRPFDSFVDSIIDFEKNYGEGEKNYGGNEKFFPESGKGSKNNENLSDNLMNKPDILPNFIEMKIANEKVESMENNIETLDGLENNRSEIFEEENVNEENEDQDNDLEMMEKLKELKMTLTGVLRPESNNISEDHDNSGKSSPTSDDMDIAREIYMSKGMSVPPSKYTSTRSLNTILEDEPLDDSEIEIPKPKPTPKVAERLEESNISAAFLYDTFEWDDYIGDELVGRVENSAVSSRKSMDFSDWTMDSSSQDSDVQNDSGAIHDKKLLSAVNISHNSSDSAAAKAGDSPAAVSQTSTKSPKTPLGASAQSYVKHILSNSTASRGTKSFYSFSHGIDLDEEAISTAPSYSTNSHYDLMDEWDM